MSWTASAPSVADGVSQNWFETLLGVRLPPEGSSVQVRGRTLNMHRGILRDKGFNSTAQDQTSDTFGFKWAKRDTFEGATLTFGKNWLLEKYGDVAADSSLFGTSERPILLDAGCGASASALALFEPVLDRMHYLGVDVSDAVDVAKTRFDERSLPAAFLQADLNQLPLPENSIDLIFSEGVLHHTDDTRAALAALARYLKPAGRILFYVYRKKGPLREFTDDYIREKLQAMTPEQAWQAMMPLSKFGKALGELNLDIDIPENIDLLGIPAGRINLQRLLYWHMLKAFYRPEMSLDEMNHVNFDWYAPRNAHRQSPDEVRAWCASLGLSIEHERIEDAGITVVARKA
jgi:arsenite methyltransferase